MNQYQTWILFIAPAIAVGSFFVARKVNGD